MNYITTKCPNCGFRTRNRESGLPSVQLGDPLIQCPSCQRIILDTIQTEYEFMTDFQKNSFKSNVASIRSYFSNAIFIIAGALFLGFSSTAKGENVIIPVVIGILLLIGGIFQIIKNNKFLKNKMLEKAIYRSLIRTSNKKYVELLSNIYSNSKVNKKYTIFLEKSSFISQNKHLLTQHEVQNIEKEVEDFVNDLLSFEEIKRSIVSETEHH